MTSLRQRAQWSFAACTIVAISVLSGPSQSAMAADASPEFRQAVTGLLEEGWVRGEEPLALARQHHRLASTLAPDDPRASYALLLVLIKQIRYPDAVALADEVTKKHPEFLPARRAKIWLNMAIKQRTNALAEMELLSEQLGQQFADRSEEAEAQDTTVFLGRMFGYLEGPIRGIVPEHRMGDALRTIQRQLTPALVSAFEAGRQEVLTQHQRLTQQVDASRTEAILDQEEQKERDRARLEGEAVNVDSEQDSLQAQAAELRQAADTALAQVDQQLIPLNAEFARLQGQAAIVQQQIARYDFDIRRNYDLAASVANTDPLLEASYLREADRLAIFVNRLRAEYAALDAQAVAINQQRAALEGRRRSIVAEYERETRRLGIRADQLRRTEQRIASDQRDADRPATGNTGRVNFQSSRATSITTYQDWPLERERNQLLQALR